MRCKHKMRLTGTVWFLHAVTMQWRRQTTPSLTMRRLLRSTASVFYVLPPATGEQIYYGAANVTVWRVQPLQKIYLLCSACRLLTVIEALANVVWLLRHRSAAETHFSSRPSRGSLWIMHNGTETISCMRETTQLICKTRWNSDDQYLIIFFTFCLLLPIRPPEGKPSSAGWKITPQRVATLCRAFHFRFLFGVVNRRYRSIFRRAWLSSGCLLILRVYV